MKLKLKHLSGKRPVYELDVTDEDIEQLVRENLISHDHNIDKAYYLGRYEILNRDEIHYQLYKPFNVTDDTCDITVMVVQNNDGELDTITDVEYSDFERNDNTCLYRGKRIISVNEFSIFNKSVEDGSQLLTKRFGILPKQASKTVDFPVYSEGGIVVTGTFLNDQTEEITYEFYGEESKNVLKHLFQLGDNLILTFPMSGKQFIVKEWRRIHVK